MSSFETGATVEASQSPRWLVPTNAVLAVCSVLAAAISFWSTDTQSIAIVVTFLILLCALGFLLGMQAHRKNWNSKWYIQILGPTLSLFVLFGTFIAVITAILGAVAVFLFARKARPHKNAA